MIGAINSAKQVRVPFSGGALSAEPQLTQAPDTFELSVKEEDKKKKKNKLLLTAAAVLTAIGISFAIYKGRGSKVVEAAENGADSLARKGQEAVTHQKGDIPSTKPIDNAVPEKPTEQPKIKEDVNPEVGKADDLEKLKIAKLKKIILQLLMNMV